MERYWKNTTKTSCYFLFSSYHSTKLQKSDKNIKCTHSVKIFQFFLWSKLKIKWTFFVCVFLFIPHHTKKENQSVRQNCARITLCKPSVLCSIFSLHWPQCNLVLVFMCMLTKEVKEGRICSSHYFAVTHEGELLHLHFVFYFSGLAKQFSCCMWCL